MSKPNEPLIEDDEWAAFRKREHIFNWLGALSATFIVITLVIAKILY
ncbi:hypothetical protein Desaci_0739 [Desulfosporosinus acidiphilus SJ4]|uniref:Uncharacterized protein n=1 Tax=Desulfosporosinus acidiphilus (strain DSM 22704 / JCM 16185 / SJ4) TaxID=646529 RepID=I4D1X6_DESAJ|nr:hypothetical protein [Desulfosporosinus acidiphilus]AFM39800.1 hypothetical protein Desaci_0739 [Desulfosporosinus acidiphilus SJ4]